MNKFTIGFIVLILLGGVLYPFLGIFPPFYYAQFNDLRDRLHEIEGLEIKDNWQPKDMRLEECGFDVEIGGRQVSLTFSDQHDWVGLFYEFDGGLYLKARSTTHYFQRANECGRSPNQGT